jgi:hypothetical protein
MVTLGVVTVLGLQLRLHLCLLGVVVSPAAMKGLPRMALPVRVAAPLITCGGRRHGVARGGRMAYVSPLS